MKLIRCFVFVWRIGQEMLSNGITQKQKKGKWEPDDGIFDELLFVCVSAIVPNAGRRCLGIPFLPPLFFFFSSVSDVDGVHSHGASNPFFGFFARKVNPDGPCIVSTRADFPFPKGSDAHVRHHR
jgi:hypothetical protein